MPELKGTTFTAEESRGVALEALAKAESISLSGEPDRAQGEYEDIIRFCEDNRITATHPYLKAVFNLAGLFVSGGRLEEARDLLHGKGKIEPVLGEQFELHETLGKIEQGLGNMEAAKSSYRKAIDLGKQKGRSLSSVVLPLCDILSQEEEFEEAYLALRNNLPYISE